MLITCIMTTLHSSGMNTTIPQVNDGDATGWRTGHLLKGECVNSVSFQQFDLSHSGPQLAPYSCPHSF